MAYGRSFDYPTLTKRGFLFGLALLLVGGFGELIGTAFFAPIPAWEASLLFDLEVIGLLIGLLAPFAFGIVLPLTE